MRDSERELDNIFLSYNKILKRLNSRGCKTKNGKEITHKNLRKVILVMQEKHPNCRWRSNKVKSRKFYIIYEGYWWLVDVFFQKEKSLIDSDVDFFEDRIREYEELLKIESDRKWWNEDMNINQLCEYFNRKDITVRKAIKKMCDSGMSQYRTYIDRKVVICKEDIEWLTKNFFKNKYLELLEKYKMELTEKYIDAGYPYDKFFGRN